MWSKLVRGLTLNPLPIREDLGGGKGYIINPLSSSLPEGESTPLNKLEKLLKGLV
ncbi:hypothetical protein DSM16313_04720 [Acinetobacter seohaensis]|nr:hypothetical protein DSM16313_04720 [Acinetobacter seohaensis]